MIARVISAENHERIMDKIQAIEDTLNRAFFDPDAAQRRLREASGELGELRRMLYEAGSTSLDGVGPQDPGAA
jgi:hypothetical protein